MVDMDLLTTKEAAELLRLCPQSVRNLCERKKLAGIRHSPNGKWLIPRQAVEAYLASLTGETLETFQPVVVQFDDVDKRMKERSARLRRAK